ncbi:MAG: hypothetical protein JNL63_04750 [Bacteroidia bacterium]|nr:hypothetical protein [Bacteroidia bacterium]
MKKIKFNIDQPDPGDEQIIKHKDFKKLLYNHELATKPLYKTPLTYYKNRKIFLFILILALLIYVITELIDEKKNSQPPELQKKEQTK